MKTIKEKAQIIQPKTADVASRIPQGIRHAAELGHTQINRSDQSQESGKPEDKVTDTVQQSTLQAVDLLGSKFKRDQARSKNPFQIYRGRSSRVSYTGKSSVPSIRQGHNALQTHANFTQNKGSHFLKSQKFASNSIAKITRSMSQKIVVSIKSLVTGLRGIGTVIAVGGWATVALVVVLAFIGWILTTPSGIFAGGGYEDNPSRSVYTVLDNLAKEVDDRINDIIEEHGDGCEISIRYVDGNENILEQVGPLVLAAYAVKISTDPTEPDQVATLDASKEAVLRDIFWQAVLMDYKEHENTVIDHSGVETTTRHLKIKIKLLSTDQLIDVLNLSNRQRDVIYGLVKYLNAAK